MHRSLLRAVAISVLALSPLGREALAAPDPKPAVIAFEDLTDDPSRSELASYELLNFAPPGDRAARHAFVFPTDAGDAIYGIDVSHHNGVVDWAAVAARQVRFVYIKTSQGERYRDSKFATNWDAAAAAGVRRGPYHFFSAGVSGKAQAAAFLALLNASGGLKPTDLAPVLDLEWDFTKVDGKQVDRWASYSSEQIAKEVADWMSAVQAATGRKPLIYTAASWWKPRMGANLTLQGYTHWIADYRESSISAGAPASVAKHRYQAWQFTDVGRLDGGPTKFDVNLLRGSNLDVLAGR